MIIDLIDLAVRDRPTQEPSCEQQHGKSDTHPKPQENRARSDRAPNRHKPSGGGNYTKTHVDKKRSRIVRAADVHQRDDRKATDDDKTCCQQQRNDAWRNESLGQCLRRSDVIFDFGRCVDHRFPIQYRGSGASPKRNPASAKMPGLRPSLSPVRLAVKNSRLLASDSPPDEHHPLLSSRLPNPILLQRL